MRRVLTTGLVALLVAACSGDDLGLEPADMGPLGIGPAPAIGLGVSGAANIIPGSTAQVTVTISRVTDFTGIVTLSAEGLPAGVSAAFTPPTAPNAATATSTLTLHAAATATPGIVAATVRAKAARVIDATVVLLIKVNP